MGNKIVVANLKMNMTNLEILNYSREINKKVESNSVVICPTNIYVSYFLSQQYHVGLQNTFNEEKGAFTGEVSPSQAFSMGISYTILGHSERRTICNETDEIINKKVIAALNNNLKVILCIGETHEEKELLNTELILKNQLKKCLKNINIKDMDNIYIAYEPVWAIGTNTIPSNDDIEKISSFIKNIVFEIYQFGDIKVLYGGSINDLNIETLNEVNNLSGFLVGGSSLDVKKFEKIIEVVVHQ